MRVVAAAIATLGLAGPAQAGAWTAEPGDAFVSETRTFGFAETPVPRTDFYAEYGWREGITVGGSVSRDGFLGFGERDDGRASVFMRQRIWQGEAGGVASVEFEIASGFGSGEDTADTTTRIRVGHGFGTPFGDAFVDADIGWRSELALTSGDRLLGGATAGLRPAPGWLAMLQVATDSAMQGLVPAPAAGADEATFTATVVRDLEGGASLSLSLAQSMRSRDRPEATQLMLGVWRRF